MVKKATQLKIRRFLRRHVPVVRDSTQTVLVEFEHNLIGRFKRLARVRRFTIGWVGLILIVVTGTIIQTAGLSPAYQDLRPIVGGSYHEGVVGTFSTANPLYATGSVDLSVSKLIFAGLLKYNNDNQLVGDLAESIAVDEIGKTYTVVLRDNLKWHDGRPLTSDDVVFTYRTIQNPDARSVLFNSVRGVGIEETDAKTIKFTLPTALSSFPNSLTAGILPHHILGKQPASELRTASFNNAAPIGAGPFKWEQIQFTNSTSADGTGVVISMDAFQDFHAGVPAIERFNLHTYPDIETMRSAFDRREIGGMAYVKSTPRDFNHDEVRIYGFPTTAAVMTFFNMESPVLSDVKIRQSLAYATNRVALAKALGQPLRTMREPMMTGTFSLDPTYMQPRQDLKLAEKTLDESGWKRTAHTNEVRKKDGKALEFRLYAEDTPDNRIIADELKKQWSKIGVNTLVQLQPSMFFQTSLETRGYDAVLYAISVGNDPDVYAYWHSSQAAPGGTNFSNYKSKTTDTALEAGRTRQDSNQRALKYKPFLKAWQEDVPALALFRPEVYYITRSPIYGLEEHVLNTDLDRYNSVAKWHIRAAYVDQK